MKAEERVKHVYPEATYIRGWIYSRDLGPRIGIGVDQDLAWADAWRRVQAERAAEQRAAEGAKQ